MKSAENAIGSEDFKWAIVKSYYSMFHAARALLFSLGLKERRHFAVEIVLEELNRKGKLESRFIADFLAAMSSREDADYRYTYSKETAIAVFEAAENFLKEMK